MQTLLTVLCILLTACFSKESNDPEAALLEYNKDSVVWHDANLNVALKKIANGLTAPVGMAVAKDDNKFLFVIEQPGRIRIIENDVLRKIPFLDITSKIDRLGVGYSEKGLLGLAFHPQYKTNGRFFVYYSAPSDENGSDHKSVVAEYIVSKQDKYTALTQEKIILEFEQPESNHNGGMLEFGPDGYLYVGTGDGGGGGDRHGIIGNSQDLSNLLGKILRIDVNVSGKYSIPNDNPFVNRKNVRSEIFAYGLRNPWRFSFDRKTGLLFAGDVGQNKFEEVDIIEKGKNYGWRIMEGFHCYNPEGGCNTNGLTMPVYEYPHAYGNSITGGYIYNGKAIYALKGAYIFGDYSGRLYALKQLNNKKWRNYKLTVRGKNSNDLSEQLNSFGEDHEGEVYLITQKLPGPKSATGCVYRIVK